MAKQKQIPIDANNNLKPKSRPEYPAVDIWSVLPSFCHPFAIRFLSFCDTIVLLPFLGFHLIKVKGKTQAKKDKGPIVRSFHKTKSQLRHSQMTYDKKYFFFFIKEKDWWLILSGYTGEKNQQSFLFTLELISTLEWRNYSEKKIIVSSDRWKSMSAEDRLQQNKNSTVIKQWQVH